MHTFLAMKMIKIYFKTSAPTFFRWNDFRLRFRIWTYINRVKITSYWLLILLAIPSFSRAQVSSTVIHGRVLGQDSEPLVYATVIVKNSSVGTITNAVGEFEIIINKPRETDSLVVSMLGYESRSFAVFPLEKKNVLIVELTEKPVQLAEVTITDKRLSAEDYLASALKNSKDNLPDKPYLLSIFFRETAKLDDRYFSLLEAAGNLRGEKQNKGDLAVNIDQIRFGLGKFPEVPVRVGENYNPFRELNASITFSKRRSPCTNCKYEIEEFSTFQGHPIVVIASYKNSEKSSESLMKFYIDLEDYGIWRFEFEAEIPFGVGFPEMLDKTTHSSLVLLKRRIDYQKVDGDYYLHQYHQLAKHDYQRHGDNKTYSTEHFFNLLVNDIQDGGQKNGKADKKMDYKRSLSAHAKDYNPDFWKTYNIIKQSPLDEKIISDLKEGSEKQDVFD